eukprot:2928756-Pyramimonas_sp.AAC.1
MIIAANVSEIDELDILAVYSETFQVGNVDTSSTLLYDHHQSAVHVQILHSFGHFQSHPSRIFTQGYYNKRRVGDDLACLGAWLLAWVLGCQT